jgi:hypothetical protein
MLIYCGAQPERFYIVLLFLLREHMIHNKLLLLIALFHNRILNTKWDQWQFNTLIKAQYQIEIFYF